MAVCVGLPFLHRKEKETLSNQEAVNELVDYAIAHGVNYFDTSPVYVQGWSEKATGIALKRHPREKLYIATKLSNFSNFSREKLTCDVSSIIQGYASGVF